MILIDKMKDFKIYKVPTFLPTLTENKKKKCAALLLTPNYESSKKMMTHPLFVNKLRLLKPKRNAWKWILILNEC